MKQHILLALMIFAPLSLAIGKDYDITMMNPLDLLNWQEGKASTNLVGKNIEAVYGEISEVRLDPIWQNGAPATEAELDKIKNKVRERIAKAKCEGWQSETKRSMALWVHGNILFKNGRILPIQIMLGGIIIGNDLLFGEGSGSAGSGSAGSGSAGSGSAGSGSAGSGSADEFFNR